MCHRMAHFVAQAEPDDPHGRRARVEESFFQIMGNQIFMPNSPTLFNAGTPNPMLSACFILPVEDSIREIYKSVGDGAVIEKLGGGIGMDFSRLRPQGARTSLGGIASGPLSFMNSFQVMSETIRQGGRRRGAMMAMLDAHHPEILLFIDCKLLTPPDQMKHLAATYNLSGSLAQDILSDLSWQAPYHGFNITVKLTDEFMEAVRQDVLYPLRDPRGGFWEGEVTDPRGEIQPAPLANGSNGVGLPARKVWERIVGNAWRSAEPGIAFIDRINGDNPVKSLGAIHSSNPCGEYWQVDYNSCNLGSINLATFAQNHDKVDDPWGARIDWFRLRDVARAATRFLDHVITMSQYPILEITEVTAKSRPVGLGVMGYADLLLKLGIRYGSPESIDVAEKVMQWVQYWAWVESAELAREFAPFPELNRNQDYFDNKMGQLTKAFTNSFAGSEFSEPEAELGTLEDLYQQWGVRNCHVTVEAPTGSISLIAECSSGIEPIFAFEYERQDSLGTRSYRHPAVEERQQAHLDQPLPEYFVDASAITPEEHILIQAAFQKHVDNAVSKTANLPSSAGPLTSVAQVIGRTIERAGEIFESSTPDAMAIPSIKPTSTPDGDSELPVGTMARSCPECGRETLYPAGGCLTCITCGYSTCGGTRN